MKQLLFFLYLLVATSAADGTTSESLDVANELRGSRSLSYDESEYGTRLGLAAFALMRFSTDGTCDLSGSATVADEWMYLWDYWKSSDGECGEEVHTFWRESEGGYGTGFLTFDFTIDTTKCTGSYSVDLPVDEKDVTNAPWSDGKLLCNNGGILAFLARRDSTQDFILYYATDDANNDYINRKTKYYELSEDLDFEEDGRYCLDLFALMTKLQSDIPANAPELMSLQCTTANTRPNPSTNCQGKAEHCSSEFTGKCSAFNANECSDNLENCEAESTCGKQTGCYCDLSGADVAYSKTLYCPGKALYCHKIEQESVCQSQAGCSWSEPGMTNGEESHDPANPASAASPSLVAAAAILGMLLVTTW